MENLPHCQPVKFWRADFLPDFMLGQILVPTEPSKRRCGRWLLTTETWPRLFQNWPQVSSWLTHNSSGECDSSQVETFLQPPSFLSSAVSLWFFLPWDEWWGCWQALTQGPWFYTPPSQKQDDGRSCPQGAHVAACSLTYKKCQLATEWEHWGPLAKNLGLCKTNGASVAALQLHCLTLVASRCPWPSKSGCTHGGPPPCPVASAPPHWIPPPQSQGGLESGHLDRLQWSPQKIPHHAGQDQRRRCGWWHRCRRGTARSPQASAALSSEGRGGSPATRITKDYKFPSIAETKLSIWNQPE